MYTMQGDGVGYEKDKSIAVDGGKIIEIAAREEIEKNYDSSQVVDARSHIVLPGLVDGHMHTTSSILRGVAQDVGNWMMHGSFPRKRYETDQSGRRPAWYSRGYT